MDQRVVIVTGAHGVLGRAVVQAVQARGWAVAAIDHGAPKADLGDAFEVGGVDLTNAVAAARAVQSVVDRFGRLDAVLNIAGGFAWQKVDDAEPAWDRMFALNLTTALNTSRSALPHLKAVSDGRIVNIGSAASLKAGAGMGAYAASKSAVHRLTESLAEELKDTGVTVNAVLPSIIDTPANRADMPEVDPGKWVAPGDLAEVVLFLASPKARAITGALVPVTGKV